MLYHDNELLASTDSVTIEHAVPEIIPTPMKVTRNS